MESSEVYFKRCKAKPKKSWKQDMDAFNIINDEVNEADESTIPGSPKLPLKNATQDNESGASLHSISSLPDIVVKSEPEFHFETSGRANRLSKIGSFDSYEDFQMSKHWQSRGSIDVSGRQKSLQYDEFLHFEGFEWSRDSPSPEPSFANFNSPSHSIARSSEKVRSRWKDAMKSVGESTSKPPGKSKITLMQLVDMLRSYKVKVKEFNEPSVETFSKTNPKFHVRSRIIPEGKRRKLMKAQSMDEKERVNIYKRTLEALLHPVSDPDVHCFVSFTIWKPITCSECDDLMWGRNEQGVKCSKCAKVCHDKCSKMCHQDCYTDDQQSAIQNRMRRMSVSHSGQIELIKEVFGMSMEDHMKLRGTVEAQIMNKVEDYKSHVVIKVIKIQGVSLLKELRHKMYVSVAVGNQVMKTKIYKNEEEDKPTPTWNQEFSFTCLNSSELIQLKVWNEKDSSKSQTLNKFSSKDEDLFLGEKIIEIQKVGTSKDGWYKLDKCTKKDPEMSAYIKVNISVTVEGEYTATFHYYYMKLYEQLFFHCHCFEDKNLVMVPPKMNMDEQILAGQESLQLLPTLAQEVLDEFSLRYGIQLVYRMMVHIKQLVQYHSIMKYHCMNHTLLVINNVIKNLQYILLTKTAIEHAAGSDETTAFLEECMDTTNFGRDKFLQVLESLLNSLKSDLQHYRKFFPLNDDQRLMELQEALELTKTIVEFKEQVLGIATTETADEIILDNMKQCLKGTFEYIVQNCKVKQSDDYKQATFDTKRQPFEFLYQIMKQMKGVILEDRNTYANVIARYCSGKLGDISAVELWKLFSSIVKDLFQQEEYLKIFTPKQYIILQLGVKSFYDAEIKPIPSHQSQVPEFPQWFVYSVHMWMMNYQKDGIDFVNHAWDDDRNNQFSVYEKQNSSSSAFYAIYYLYQGLVITKSLESGDLEVKHLHLKDYALVIITVEQHYADKLCSAISEFKGDLETMCMLMNNLQELRIKTCSLFMEMGGLENAGEGANRVLSDFQQQLSKQLRSCCEVIAKSLSSEICAATKNVQSGVMMLDGEGYAERATVETIAEPLLGCLASNLKTIREICEQTSEILHICIKEVWHICQENFNSMLFPGLKRNVKSCTTTSPDFDYPLHNYTSMQCSALEILTTILVEFFVQAEHQNKKKVERGAKRQKSMIAMYRKTTEALISDFIRDEIRFGLQMKQSSCGEVHLEVNASTSRITGELKGSIGVIAAKNLKPLSGVDAIKSAIELYLVAPKMSRLKFLTGTKSTADPSFNEFFKFTLGNDWEDSEVVVIAKQKSKFFGKDQVIGVGAVPFCFFQENASLHLGLSPNLFISERGKAILNVLAVRTNDNFAMEFVTLKTSERS